MCCTPDGELAVSASEDRTLRVWDLESGECKKTLTGHTYPVHDVCCTPDGKLAISASDDRSLRVWDIETGECKKTLTGHTWNIGGVCCTPDGKLAISASRDRSLRVWDLQTGECIGVNQARSRINAIAFGSGGHFVYGCDSYEAVFIRPFNLLMESPLLTLARLWVYGIDGENGRWDDNITATCAWCGYRFIVTPKTIETISRSSFATHTLVAPETIEFNDQRNLKSNCPNCNKLIRFNPFIVDNKNAVDTQRGFSKTLQSTAQPSTQKPRVEQNTQTSIQRPQANPGEHAVIKISEHSIQPPTQKPQAEATEPQKQSKWKKLFKR